MKTLVITPMQQELNVFVQSCMDAGFEVQQTTCGKLVVFQIPDLAITLARGGTGKAQFALQTQHLLDQNQDWHLVICAGAAGALVDDLAIGDVVIGSTTLEHDYVNRFNTRPRPQFDGSPQAIEALKQASTAFENFSTHTGIIASGDEDIITPERKAEIHALTGALAVAWEGAGGARACQFSSIPYVEIRSVTDTADHTAPSDFMQHLKTAMHNIAMLLMHW